MQRMSQALRSRCERVLASYIVELSTELRQHDAANLIALIQLERLETIRRLVDGDCEFLFKPSTMRFGSEAEVIAGWASLPTINLAMEFYSDVVEVYFRLSLAAREAAVEIDHIRFVPSSRVSRSYSAALSRALRDARLIRSPERSREQLQVSSEL